MNIFSCLFPGILGHSDQVKQQPESNCSKHMKETTERPTDIKTQTSAIRNNDPNLHAESESAEANKQLVEIKSDDEIYISDPVETSCSVPESSDRFDELEGTESEPKQATSIKVVTVDKPVVKWYNDTNRAILLNDDSVSSSVTSVCDKVETRKDISCAINSTDEKHTDVKDKQSKKSKPKKLPKSVKKRLKKREKMASQNSKKEDMDFEDFNGNNAFVENLSGNKKERHDGDTKLDGERTKAVPEIKDIDSSVKVPIKPLHQVVKTVNETAQQTSDKLQTQSKNTHAAKDTTPMKTESITEENQRKVTDSISKENQRKDSDFTSKENQRKNSESTSKVGQERNIASSRKDSQRKDSECSSKENQEKISELTNKEKQRRISEPVSKENGRKDSESITTGKNTNTNANQCFSKETELDVSRISCSESQAKPEASTGINFISKENSALVPETLLSGKITPVVVSEIISPWCFFVNQIGNKLPDLMQNIW